MATAEQYANWIVRNADKRGTPEFETVAAAYKAARAPVKAESPVSESDMENARAGLGKSFADTGRRLGQLVRMVNPSWAVSADLLGLPGDQATIDEAKRLDAPLMKTKAGFSGNLLGNAAQGVLTAPVAGAGVVGGAVTGGALGGLTQPVASDESGLANIAIGGIAGGAAPILARLASAGYGAIKGAMEPFTEAGRRSIAGRTLERFGITPADVRGLSGAPTTTGARLTLAEQIQRPEAAAGAARLQDAIRSLDPEIAGRLVAREGENNAARVNLLKNLAGEDGARAFAVAERAGTAGPIYEDAFKASGALTPSQLKAQADLIKNGGIEKLMQSPAIQAAMKEAQTNAANSGRKMTADGSIEGLHNMKLAIDDMIKDPATAAQANKVASLKAARDRLVSVIETLSPEYKTARTVYRDMSKPINQMDVAAEVLRKGAPKETRDLSGNLRLMHDATTGTLRDEAALIRSATGRKDAGNSLADLLEPDQLNALRAVVSEVDRSAAVARAANGPGSGTAQRLASTNLLRQIGLPENMVDNALVQTLMRPVQFGAKVAEPRIQQVLLDIVLDPAKAQAALAAATPAQRVQLQKLISNPQLAQAIRASVPAGALGARQRGE